MPAASEMDLLNAAIRVVEERGLEGLTLRPLAQCLGITVSALSHRYGQKQDILLAICHAGAQAEAQILDRWRRRTGDPIRLDRSQLADLADAVLDDLSRSGRGLMRLQGELIQKAVLHADLRDHLQGWLQVRHDFWRDVSAPSGQNIADALHGYAIDEIAYGTVLGDDSAYRWLRKLCVNRLCAGILASGGEGGAWEIDSFETVWLELGDTVSNARFEAGLKSDTARMVADHAANILMTRGADLITYRSVAEASGLAPSTLVYHFPHQSDLLHAGLEHIIKAVHMDIDAEATSRHTSNLVMSHAPSVAIATYAVTHAAVRHPKLKPFVMDMRRRRGENGLHQLRKGSAAPARIDRLTAQVVSVVSLGAIIADRAKGSDSAPELVSALFDLCRKG